MQFTLESVFKQNSQTQVTNLFLFLMVCFNHIVWAHMLTDDIDEMQTKQKSQTRDFFTCDVFAGCKVCVYLTGCLPALN